ncbi:AraC family transcriptional regulator [Cohnella soli]|uniref:Helix-turn-helix domain-containing protein n=1 Tax=Cohnella soli TaxID=425005 RepID=A0ABW0HMX7_9BACL
MENEIRIASMTHTLQIVGCHFGVKEPFWSYPRHHHHLFELLYCWDGEVTLSTEDYEFTLETGDLLLLKPGVKHHMHNNSAKPYSFFNVHFNIDDQQLRDHLSANAYEHMKKSTIQQTRLPACLQQLEALLQTELQNPDRHGWNDSAIVLHLAGLNKLLFQSQVLLLIAEVAALLDAGAHLHREWDRRSTTTEVDIAHAIESMIQNNMYTDIKIEEIANQLNLSRSQCYKVFTKVYGMSPRQYLTQLMLKQAKQHLLENELTIEAIAAKLGFSSISHFSRQFKRWTGVSPAQYRPKHFIRKP